MEKLKMHTPNLTQENITRIRELFPGCVTEAHDENSQIRLVVDFDQLRQELSESIVEGPQERYHLNWPGKREALLTANAPIAKTLRPCRDESVDFDTTKNLFIEGDNLDALKLLQETYLGKVKMIYIDPPYNTGNDFIYEDDFAETNDAFLKRSNQKDEEGNRLVANTEANGRFHSDWLSMMYTRLKLAKNLLNDDGAIFISIDDNEGHNLKKMCDEIFGEDNFVANVAWQRTYSSRNDSTGIVNEVEHILIYGKQQDWSPNKLPRTDEMNSIYKNPDNDDRAWTSSSITAPGAVTHQGMVYAIQHPFTGEMIYPTTGRCWSLGQKQMLENLLKWCEYELKDIGDVKERADVCGISINEIRPDVKAIVLSESLEISREKAQKVLERGRWPYFYFTNGGKGGIRRKTHLEDLGGRLPTNFWSCKETGHNDEAKKEIISLFDGTAPFDTPKPTRLIDRILTIATNKDSIILDFFSGSATTAHSVFKKNIEDQGHRKFILVQLPEKTKSPIYKNLCEISKERIRRAGKKIKEENATTSPDLDTGFRVLKIDSSNMADVYYTPDAIDQKQLEWFTDNIKPGRTAEDLLFQVLLDYGVDLTFPIRKEIILDKTVFFVDENALVACFDTGVNEELVKHLAQFRSYDMPIRKIVFRDNGFASDAVKINVEQIFKQMSQGTEVKSI